MKVYQSEDTIKKIIEYIKKRKGGFYIRFGDGDLNISNNHNDMLNNTTPIFSNEMIESMKINDECYFRGFPLMCNKYGLLEDGMFGGNHEWPEKRCDQVVNYLNTFTSLHEIYTPVAFQYMMTMSPQKCCYYLHILKDIIKSNNCIIIGNKNLNKRILNLYFSDNYHFIECPSRNSYNEIDRIEKQIIKNISVSESYYIIICCAGCTTRVLSKRLFTNRKFYNFFFLDIGSIVDALSGLDTRAYIKLTNFDNSKFHNMFTSLT